MPLPQANLMVRAEPLHTVSESPTPQEVMEVDALNHGLYGEVASRLHLLQDWVRDRSHTP